MDRFLINKTVKERGHSHTLGEQEDDNSELVSWFRRKEPKSKSIDHSLENMIHNI